MKSTRLKKRLAGISAAVIFCALTLAVFAIVSGSVGKAGSVSQDEGIKLLEKSIRRAAVSCYASEGIYPPNLDYIAERYGLIIDESRYAVHYEIFADNIMPEITVVSLG